jgi:azobenzene reductase
LYLYGIKGHIEAIRTILRSANGIILVSPEYHGSNSGVLKNALDHYWNEFKKVPTGVATASAGKFGGINASVQLQHVILSMGGFPVPSKLIVPEIQNITESSDNTSYQEFLKHTAHFLDEYLWFCNALQLAKNEV